MEPDHHLGLRRDRPQLRRAGHRPRLAYGGLLDMLCSSCCTSKIMITTIYSFIILGGFPLCLSILAFLTHGIYKNIIIIEKRIHVYFYCGLLAIISESFLWDAYDSPFFWIIITYAITFSKGHLITKEGSRAIT